jgi:uncharacterized membrane protein YcaP (DUF421 family)
MNIDDLMGKSRPKKVQREYTDMERAIMEGGGEILSDDVYYLQKELEQQFENFADGKKPGRKGLAKRMGVDCSKSETALRKIAKNSSGERQRMAHWCANMKGGRK